MFATYFQPVTNSIGSYTVTVFQPQARLQHYISANRKQAEVQQEMETRRFEARDEVRDEVQAGLGLYQAARRSS